MNDNTNDIFKNLSGEKKKLIEELSDYILNRTLNRILTNLNTEQQKQLIEIFTNGNKQQKEEFFKNLAKEGINFQDIYFEETLKTINEVEEHLKTKETT